MRKVISLMHSSLDGFVGTLDGGLESFRIDDEITTYVDQLISTADTALYGRVTYQMMEGYWPTVPANPDATRHERDHANWVEHASKIVFSRSLAQVTWNNSRIVKDHIVEEISRLKSLPGKHLMIFGSPRLTHTFMELDLIDEYRITVNPVVLGRGIPMFTDDAKPAKLKLLETKSFQSGVVALGYERDRT
jgi:dihydrofolate reductase